MANGMMWLDDSPKKSLENKIKEGFDFFENKYGKNLLSKVLINKKTRIDENQESICGLAIMHSEIVLENHYWFIVKDEFDGMVLKEIKI